MIRIQCEHEPARIKPDVRLKRNSEGWFINWRLWTPASTIVDSEELGPFDTIEQACEGLGIETPKELLERKGETNDL